MKTLINNFTKGIILPLVFVGIGLKGYCQEINSHIINDTIQGVPNEIGYLGEISPLEKYNLENQQVRDDIVNFVKEKGEKRSIPGFDIYWYKKYFDKQEHNILVDSDNDTKTLINFMKPSWSSSSFSDKGSNGLDFYWKEEFGKHEKPISEFPEEKQLELAKEDINNKKKILHAVGYKGY